MAVDYRIAGTPKKVSGGFLETTLWQPNSQFHFNSTSFKRGYVMSRLSGSSSCGDSPASFSCVYALLFFFCDACANKACNNLPSQNLDIIRALRPNVKHLFFSRRTTSVWVLTKSFYSYSYQCSILYYGIKEGSGMTQRFFSLFTWLPFESVDPFSLFGRF